MKLDRSITDYLYHLILSFFLVLLCLFFFDFSPDVPSTALSACSAFGNARHAHYDVRERATAGIFGGANALCAGCHVLRLQRVLVRRLRQMKNHI